MSEGEVAVGSTIGGRFRLARVLATGEISTLYEATATNGRKWAVRVLDPRHEGDVRERFVREANRIAGVKSEHVVDVREVDEKHRPPFVVEELLDGFDLDTLLARGVALEPKIAARIVLQAARGLDAEVLDGVQRADLATSDLFLHRSSAEGVVVKLTDATTRVLEPKTASLVPKLGRVLFALLLGRAPKAGDDVGTLELDPALRRIVREMVDDTAKLSELPARLATWIDGSLTLTTNDLGPADAMFRRNNGTPTDNPDLLDVPDEPQPASLLGETLGEKYRLDRLLGHGGMGAVYEARGPNDSTVAVKVVLGDHRKPDSLRRFVREARTATAIDSPYVVRVLEVEGDKAHGVPYIVMELLRGIDLEQAITEQGALEPSIVARMFVQACAGLSAVHARGVVHRDVKPSNLFLNRGEDGRITTKICDFGIAKQLQREAEAYAQSTDLTRTGSMIGSPPYMSPEQAKSSKDIDERSDVWSLGAALYEALSGRRLWEGRTSLGELMAAIIREPVPHLENVAPWVDAGLAAVVARTLEKDKALRYASMQELAAALEPFAAPESAFVASAVKTVSEARRSALPPRPPGLPGQTTSSFAHSGVPQPTKSKLVPLAIVAAGVVTALIGAMLLHTDPPAPAPATTTSVASAPTVVVPPRPTQEASSAQVAAPASVSVAPPASVAPPPPAAANVKPVLAPKASGSKKKPNEDPVPNIF
jgi:serine/threonine-protein kinase